MASLVEAADNAAIKDEVVLQAPSGEGSGDELKSAKTAAAYAEEHLNHAEPAPVGENIGREIYYDPGAVNTFVVRGKTYMHDGKKTAAGPAMGTLLHAVR